MHMGVTVSVISGKGGTGKTTLCAGIAACLAAEGKRVLCIDADIGLRNLDIALGMAEQPRCRVHGRDAGLLQAVRRRGASGPAGPVPADGPGARAGRSRGAAALRCAAARGPARPSTGS